MDDRYAVTSEDLHQFLESMFTYTTRSMAQHKTELYWVVPYLCEGRSHTGTHPKRRIDR